MARALVAGILLAASLGAVGALAWWAGERAPGDDGAHHVLVVGPGGATLHDAQARAAEATALTLLLATGLDVEVATYPGMGAYVRAIEGHEAQGGAGWVYETSTDGATWTSGDRAANERPLVAGERLAWRWSQTA